MPYSSGFEAIVGQFLQNYSATRGLRMQEQEASDRKRQAQRADQVQQAQLNEMGYDVLPMPKIEAPPDQSFAQRIGHMLSRSDSEPGSIVMKTHPSTREQEIQGQQTFQHAENEGHYANERAIEGLRAAISANELRTREAGADRRNQQDNATALQVAGMNHSTQIKDQARLNKERVVDDALNANHGVAQEAWNQIPANVKQQYGITPFDMNQGVGRFRTSRAMLSREGMQSREDIANNKNAGTEAFRARLLGGSVARGGGAATAPSDPATMADADAWEYYVAHGMTPEQATAQVNARRKK